MLQGSEEYQPASHFWQALRVFNLYRVLLAISFLLMILFKVDFTFVGVINEALAIQTSVFYLAISLLFLSCSMLFRYYYPWQANIPIFVDILTIIVLMHTLGGLISGVGILLIVIVAAHSLLVPGKLSLLSAAIATISIFVECSFSILSQKVPIHVYTQVGLLGIAIFGTACVTNLLSIRARKSQKMIENQAYQLAASRQLNAHIVSAMHAGVLFFDSDTKIRLFNSAAKKLLGIPPNHVIDELKDLPLSFQECCQQWRLGEKHFSYYQSPPNPDIRLSFHLLGKGLPAGTLVFIYDAAEETRHAQELKLASLGHLTANIAHELRNPLGCASHAAQLLAESNQFTTDDLALVKMIKQSCDRMNTVIQNVLSLSNRKPAKTEKISLIPWLKQFIQELSIPYSPTPQVKLEYDHSALFVNIDQSQLTQILINLCENGLRASIRKTGHPTLVIKAQSNEEAQVIYLDVIDQGEGIPANVIKHIFEPFFTTESTGSGLGLYIAKELGQMNGARVDHCHSPIGCLFRVTLAQEEAPI